MAGPSKNKARNQVKGSRRGIDDAAWFKNRRKQARQRAKIAKQSRRNNRR